MTLNWAGMLLALHLGRLKDQHVITPEQVSPASSTTPGNRWRRPGVPLDPRGNGITLEYPIIRHMNNLESVHLRRHQRDAYACRRARAAHWYPRLPMSPRCSRRSWPACPCQAPIDRPIATRATLTTSSVRWS